MVEVEGPEAAGEDSNILIFLQKNTQSSHHLYKDIYTFSNEKKNILPCAYREMNCTTVYIYTLVLRKLST